jgi:gamma-glutamyltranspeptidase/glutathione hydrolase
LVLKSIFRPNKDEVIAKNGIVTAMQSYAAEAGLKMLKRGGNAVDAAVAMGFCDIVVEPYMACLGGMGFMLIHLAEEERTVAIDFNARAPRNANPNLYNVIGSAPSDTLEVFVVANNETRFSAKGVTVPTLCAGLCKAHELYGNLPRKQVMKPAINLASRGFEANWEQTLWMANAMQWIQSTPVIARSWLPNGRPPISTPSYWRRVSNLPVEKVIQRDLGRLLKQIAREGPDALYKGKVAAAIVEEVHRRGGVLTKEDLAEYQPGVLEPLAISYRDYTIMGVPTPSGTPTVLETFNILENFDLKSLGHNTSDYLHLFIECARHAFADRFRYLGDWEITPVPIKGLLSKGYGKEISLQVDHMNAAIELELDQEPWVYYLERSIHDPWKYDPQPGPETPYGAATTTSDETTSHFNVVDKDRNAVTCTHTGMFHAGVNPRGTGVYLAGGVTWFIPKAGYANSVGGWKRPMVNMAPLMVLKDGRPILPEGAPGGRKIINRNTQVILNVLEFGMGIQDAVTLPTVDASSRETTLSSRLPQEVIKKLKAKLHRVKIVEEGPEIEFPFARPSGILIDYDTNLLHGGVDVFGRAIAMGY